MGKLLKLLLACCALAPGLYAGSHVVTCHTADYGLGEGNPPAVQVASGNTIRVGANDNATPGGRNAVFVFPMPVIPTNESLTTVQLVFTVSGSPGSPTFNGDLWGIGFQANTNPLLEYFEADSGDTGNTKLADNVLTPTTAAGPAAVNTPALAAYLREFYTNNPAYGGGTYAFLRLNPDTDAGTNSIGWGIYSADTVTNAALLTITTTNGLNTRPLASNQNVIVVEDMPKGMVLTGSDADDDALTFQVVAGPTNGLLSLLNTNTGSVTYTPNTNYTGADSFRFQVNDGKTNSGIATVTIFVTPANAGCTNFIVLVTDDHRWDALGVVQREMGAAGRYPWFTNGTPNLDRLAAGGIRFRNAFLTLSLCSPSRAAIQTGRYNHLNTIIDNGTPFPTNSVTFATQLRQAGYATAWVGKWHMDGQLERPGYDFAASYTGQGNFFDTEFYVNGVSTPTTGWVDDVATDFALSFIQTNLHRPFALVVGYKSAHGPRDPPSRVANLYTNEYARPVPNLGLPTPWDSTPSSPTTNNLQDYFRCITAMDQGVGRILDALDAYGLTTNTIVIFCGDNGYYHGEHGRADKRSAYEESIRIPMIVRYPKLIPQAAVRDEMVLHLDFAPTILDLAGVPLPGTMQGASWRPLFAGNTNGWRQSFLYEYFLEGSYDTPTLLAVRTTTAKLIMYPGHPDWSEMFDLASDRYETNNLYTLPAHAATRDSLRACLDQLMIETGLAGRLGQVSRSNTLCTLQLTGGIGPRFQIESSTNLQTWLPVQEVKMTSLGATVTDTNGAAARKLYRGRIIAD